MGKDGEELDDEEGEGIGGVLSRVVTNRALDLLEGQAALRAQGLIAEFLHDFEPVAEAAGKLVGAVESERESTEQKMLSLRKLFNPYAEQAFSNLGYFDGNSMMAFFHNSARQLQSTFVPLYQGLFQIAEIYDRRIRPVFKNTGNIRSLGDLERADEAMRKTAELAANQLFDGVLKFEEVVARTYMQMQKRHKSLREKYQGLEPEDEEEGGALSLVQLLGEGRRGSKPAAPRPALELVDDNCVLTEALLGIVASLPVHVERSVPQARNGRGDGRTKVVKRLDKWAVERSAETLVQTAHPELMNYLNNPDLYVQQVTAAISGFYAHYKELEPLLRGVLSASSDLRMISIRISGEGVDKRIADPDPVVRRLQRLSFLSIKPDPLTVMPQNKVEMDYAAARREVLKHLNSTIDELLEMPDGDDGTEKESLAVEAVRKAVGLKEAMEDVVQPERKRRLRENVLTDNEFFVGRKGRIGEFSAEREPAPTNRYSDVYGEDFATAKEHIEEVVKVAAFPSLLKLSSPRGTLKSNVLLIGPYGCGKTELARAVAADPRVIGLYVSVSDVLTAWMHESVNNVKRVFEEAKRLRQGSRSTKPVAVVLDEFDAWFATGNSGYSSGDMVQIQRVLQEVMDGVVYYDGVFTLALTNQPGIIPPAILRRFKYVDVVGRLTLEERAQLLEKFLTRGMPVAADVGKDDYRSWAQKLADAPGDVIGKVADEVHFKLMRPYLTSPEHQRTARRAEKRLGRLLKERSPTDADYSYVRQVLARFRPVTGEEITQALDYMLRQPAVKLQIEAARAVYRESAQILEGLVAVGDEATAKFGMEKRSKIWRLGKD